MPAHSTKNGFSAHKLTDAPDFLDVLIVGAGFSGLGMAIKLLEAGTTSFLVIEKADDIGGTWYANQYPGCACDIPSHLYSFSFDRNPEWSRMYAGREEIQTYLKACVSRYGLEPYIRVNTAMQQAVWDEAAALWRVTAANGTIFTARVLVSAVARVSTDQRTGKICRPGISLDRVGRKCAA